MTYISPFRIVNVHIGARTRQVRITLMRLVLFALRLFQIVKTLFARMTGSQRGCKSSGHHSLWEAPPRHSGKIGELLTIQWPMASACTSLSITHFHIPISEFRWGNMPAINILNMSETELKEAKSLSLAFIGVFL